MKMGPHDIGVCSWSLRAPDIRSMIASVRFLGLSHCQLALTPLILADEPSRTQQIDLIKHSALTLPAGMISFPGEDYSSIPAIRRTGGFVPDDQWPARREIAQQAIPMANSLGIKKISTHIGFIPPSNHENYPVMIDRVSEIARLWSDAGLDLLMETGQEPAPELLQFLHDIPSKNVSINFDPANMILYGAGDPIEAIAILGRHIAHVHVKDALPSGKPGLEWGTEVPFGTGQVDAQKFLSTLRTINYTGPLTIEREGRAANPIADIQAAIHAILGGMGGHGKVG
jgi:L-ribulose-5-phosphate 3-epimerase